MKKELKKIRATAALLAMITLGSTTTGCEKKDTDTTTNNNNVSSSTFDVKVSRSYTITLGSRELVLNDEQYEELVNAILNNGQFYDGSVDAEQGKNVEIERYYSLKVFGEDFILSQKDYDTLVAQLLEYGLNGLVTETTFEDTFDVDDESYNYEPLTTENFESLVSEYANKYSDEYDGVVSTKDITKFASIANIDLLSEENSELASTLFGNQTKEEYLNDAAKIIGATVMYDFNKWNSTLSTKDFIKVSDIIYGEQKEQMIKIEEYTDRIASAVNKDDADLVNNIVSEFLTDMNSGSLSKLDDGVGFAAQVNIAVIADGIARNYLNKENFDMFQVLKTGEKYVSNIFTEYDNCVNSDTKTLVK